MSADLRLNLGAGRVRIDGFTPVDREQGQEAYPLDFPDDSASVIRASHILEHFSRRDARRALADWYRVLKPGGWLLVAVPDVDRLNQDDPLWPGHLMGGQTDENDFHRSCYTSRLLSERMQVAGFVDIQPWTDNIPDTSQHYVSLNLKGRKPVVESEKKQDEKQEIRIKTISSVPRFGPLGARGIQENTLGSMKLALNSYYGAFWGQHMQRGFEDAIRDETDWILTLDYDTIVSPAQLNRLFETFGGNPDIDALAALQPKRNEDYPLLSVGGNETVDVGRDPILVTTAHFGLTLIRVECLKTLPKPWFWSAPDKDGSWGDGKQDDDIYFWHRFREAGHKIYVDPECRIGHLEEAVSFFNEQMEVERVTIPEWRTRFLTPKTQEKPK